MKAEIVRFVVRFAIEAWRNAQQARVNRDGKMRWLVLEDIHDDTLALLRLASKHKKLAEMECSAPNVDGAPTWAEVRGECEMAKLALFACTDTVPGADAIVPQEWVTNP